LSKHLSSKYLLPFILLLLSSCASSSVNWQGELDDQAKLYMHSFEKFRTRICVPRAEIVFGQYLKAYRGQGYWIPELNDDVDVETITSLIPELEKKLEWIKSQQHKVNKLGLPSKSYIHQTRGILSRLLELKKTELSRDEKLKISARQESLKLQKKLSESYEELIKNFSFLSNYQYPVDHLKNRKVFDEYREKEDAESVKIANYTFLYRKLLEDGAYNPDRSGPDIYLRTTIDTLHFELKRHGFYLTEDARYDMEFVLSKMESELKRGKRKMLARLEEWRERTERALNFYRSLTLPDNQKLIDLNGRKTTRNRELIKEHNIATEELKEFVYTKQAEVYKYWLNQSELHKAIFVLETILLNEVGGVDGQDALERMDVARVVMNRLDKPKYLSIGKKEFIYPYLKKQVSDHHLKSETWLNALFKQGEFSFTYYYMNGVSMIFCPDIAPAAKKLRAQNVEIALQVLKEDNSTFKATRYFSRASMIGRIHMDSVWDDYSAYPERAGLLAPNQKKLKRAFERGQYSYLYSFQDPLGLIFQVVEIDGVNYALGEKNNTKLFYHHRNPHYFRYFTKLQK
jgi:hypothetical protein